MPSKKAYIHAIYGPTDLLPHPGVDKLITSFGLYVPVPQSARSLPILPSPRTISSILLSWLISLNLNPNQITGSAYSEYSFTYRPPSFLPTVQDQALKATIDMVKQ